MKLNRSDLAALVLGVALLAYTTARAALLSFTHDEALTWLFHVRAPLGQVLGFGGTLPTNNHLLNTLLAKITCAIFGPSELALRLPNLAAHAMFLWCSWRLLRRFAAPADALAGFIVVNAQPFVLDFFSLCRGYGLSIGLLMAGLDALSDSRRHFRAFLFLALGALSAFSLLNAFAGAALAALLIYRSRVAPLAWGAALAAYVVPVFWKLRPELEFGGVVGVWHDTAGTLANCAPYGVTLHPMVYVAAGLALVAGIVFSRDRVATPPRLAAAFAVVLAGSAVCEEATHLVAHTRFLTDRMAAFYLPLTALTLLFTLGLRPRLGRPLWWCAAAFALGHLAGTLNLDHTYLWAYDADDKQLIAELPRRPLSLGVTWVFSPALEYYRQSRGLSWLQPVTRDGPFGDHDFVFVTPGDRPEAERRGLVLLKKFPSGNCLFRR